MKNKNAGWQRVLLLVIPYIIIVGLFQFIGFLAIGIDPKDFNHQQTTEQQFILSTFSFLGTFLVIWIFIKFIDKIKFTDIGFQFKGWSNEFARGLGIGTFIMVFAYLSLTVLNELKFDKIIFNPKDFAISVLLFLIVSFTEEILLRGYVLRNLMISFNKYIALLVSSVLFSLMHGFNPNVDLISLINIFLAGLILGISYIHTKSLWFPIALHFSWNLFQTLLGFKVSGQDSYSLIQFSLNENNLINGGEFGFEGSVLATIAQLITIFSIGLYYHKKMKINSVYKNY